MRRTTPTLITVLLATLAFTLTLADQIDWFKGDVEAAFARAEREQKPIFLYWGAVWCPPCNQIKKTIFTQREFIEKSKLFVPVYLDGDTESAQVWGEKLDVWGYPTMLVLSPEGREVMRMPTGLQIEEFNEVLDEAMQRLTPIEEVLQSTLAAKDPADVPDDSYRLLAYYSWGQNRQLEMSARKQEEAFRQLAEQVPPRLAAERSRLYLLWLDRALSLADTKAAKGEKKFKFSKADRKEADIRVREILESEELRLANLEFVTYYAGEVIPALHKKNDKAFRALVSDWLLAAEWAEKNAALSVGERLDALFPPMDIHDLTAGKDAPYEKSFLDHVRSRVAWTDEHATDHYTRQATMSTAGYILRRVGLDDEAKQLYLAEIEKSETPWYFMSSLSSMAEKAGDNEKAVYWLRQAYDTSKGRATRFQWGTSYLIGLMNLVPDDSKQVVTESERVLGEMLSFDDAFAGRNNSRIKRLTAKYAEWNANDARERAIDTLRTALLPTCQKLSDEPELSEGEAAESLRGRCSEFFTNLGQGEEG